MAAIGFEGRAVVAALEAGRALRRMGDAWRGGALVATAGVVGELKRHDLVREDGDMLVLTPAGQGFTARAGRPEASSRVLVERTLAPGGEGLAGGANPARGRRVTVNMAESPLGWLLSRGLVSERQFAAGERLRVDWTMASLAPRVTMRWEEGPASRVARGPGSAVEPALAQIAAKRRFEAGVAAAGQGLSDILWRVVCSGEGLEMAEKALGWPKRAGKLVLLMALDRLADHYAIK